MKKGTKHFLVLVVAILLVAGCLTFLLWPGMFFNPYQHHYTTANTDTIAAHQKALEYTGVDLLLLFDGEAGFVGGACSSICSNLGFIPSIASKYTQWKIDGHAVLVKDDAIKVDTKYHWGSFCLNMRVLPKEVATARVAAMKGIAVEPYEESDGTISADFCEVRLKYTIEYKSSKLELNPGAVIKKNSVTNFEAYCDRQVASLAAKFGTTNLK